MILHARLGVRSTAPLLHCSTSSELVDPLGVLLFVKDANVSRVLAKDTRGPR